MKFILILLTLMCNAFVYGQKVSGVDSLIWDNVRCAVAHYTKDGWFECDFKGTFYPYHIFDTTIKKWFIKIQKNGDSLFYYRSYFEKVYIWNGGDRDGEYGYEWKTGGGSVTLPDKYKGYDTLRIIEQVWEPKKKK